MQGKIKIIIADDNPNIRQTLKDILMEKGYSVETVKNGYELLAYLKEKSPHIVVLDLIMPGKDGIAIFATIKCISPNAKIIIYTGFQKYKNSVYARKADRFLLKSGNPKMLVQSIADLAGDKIKRDNACQITLPVILKSRI